MSKEIVRLDPTRMAQGIMTGIGFLGAGVILKERLAIQGLTTAASIWATAAIGIALGLGWYFVALAAELIVLLTLSLFRWIEGRAPSLEYGRLIVQFRRGDQMSEAELVKTVNEHQIVCTRTSYHLEEGTTRYEMTIQTQDVGNFRKLAETLGNTERVLAFSMMR